MALGLILAVEYGMGTSLGVLRKIFVPSSNIGSARSSRPILQTYEAKSDVIALAYV